MDTRLGLCGGRPSGATAARRAALRPAQTLQCPRRQPVLSGRCSHLCSSPLFHCLYFAFPAPSQHLIAMLSQIKSLLGLPSLFSLISSTPFLFSHSLHDFCTHPLHYQSHSDLKSSPRKVTKILPRLSCLCSFLHVLFSSSFCCSSSLLYLTTVSDRNPMLTTSLSADLVPRPPAPPSLLGSPPYVTRPC